MKYKLEAIIVAATILFAMPSQADVTATSKISIDSFVIKGQDGLTLDFSGFFGTVSDHSREDVRRLDGYGWLLI